MRLRRFALVVGCVGACAWAALVVAAPWLASRGVPSSPTLRLSAAAYVAGSLVCHQRPARSFHLAGSQLPVCARCTALYVSAAVALLVVAVVGRSRLWSPPSRAFLLAALLPTAVSVGLEVTGWWAGSNAWRAASAVPAGWAGGAIVAEFLSFRGKL